MTEVDIVTRLRGHIAITTRIHYAKDGYPEPVYVHGPSPICHEAADEIERLRSVVEAWLKYSQRAERDIETIRAERDEARWRLCKLVGDNRGVWGCEIAKENGWDYLATEDKP